MWKTISGIELILIITLLYLIFINKKKKKHFSTLEKNIIKDSKSEIIDMGNIVDSVFKATELHNLLKKKVHADRFAPNLELMKIADELASQINNNKSNYAKLLELKKIAEEKLLIKFL